MGDHGHIYGPQTSTAWQKQYRQYESAGWVDIATGAEVHVRLDEGHV